MAPKKQMPPTTERTFRSPWFELDYLCKKMRFWLYIRKQKHRAYRYLTRLEQVLEDLPDNDLAIIRQEGLAILNELKGNLSQSIVHRTREIELIKRLYREAQLPKYQASTRAYMLQNLGPADVQSRREILQALKKQKLGRNGNGVPE